MKMSIKSTQLHSKYPKECEHAHTHSYSEFQTDTEMVIRTISSYLGFLLKLLSLKNRPLNGIPDQRGK